MINSTDYKGKYSIEKKGVQMLGFQVAVSGEGGGWHEIHPSTAIVVGPGGWWQIIRPRPCCLDPRPPHCCLSLN